MHRSLLAAMMLAAPSAFGGEIWSAMVLASNPAAGEQPTPPPTELAPFVKRLSKVLKAEQFEILGSAAKTIGKNDQERWLVPSPTFLLGVQARSEGKDDFRINLELYQEKRRLLQTEARLGLQSPLFISGPKHARGQLVIVFEIRP
jgi:hypothetical protein